MKAVASILSIIIFLAFVTTGAQKMIFNTMASHAAEHLGLKKRSFQLVGLVEVLGALGVMIGLAARYGSPLALVNEAAAGVLLLVTLIESVLHWRQGDGLRGSAPTLLLASACLVELIVRVS